MVPSVFIYPFWRIPMFLGSFEPHPVLSVFYRCQGWATVVQYFAPPVSSEGVFQTLTQNLSHRELGHMAQFMELQAGPQRERERMNQRSWGRKGFLWRILGSAGRWEMWEDLEVSFPERRTFRLLGAGHFVQWRRGLLQFCIGRGVCGVPPPFSTPPLSLPSITWDLTGCQILC